MTSCFFSQDWETSDPEKQNRPEFSPGGSQKLAIEILKKKKTQALAAACMPLMARLRRDL
jgi:hypothetical protein